MYENNIEDLLSKDKSCKSIFIGCFARDELPTIKNYPSCFILNTKPRASNGEHWLAIYINREKVLYFFDSYGFSPQFYDLNSFIDNNSILYEWNTNRIQGQKPYCGYYCVLFLLYVTRKKLHLFYNKFKNDFIYNDNFIYNNMIKYLK